MIPGLNTRAELELFLVSKRAKPAAFISLDAFVSWIDADISARRDTGFADLTHAPSLSETDLRNLERYFSLLSVHYRLRDRGSYSVPGSSGKKYSIDIANYYLGQHEKSLAAVIQAFHTRDDYIIGQALGFPEAACRSYGKIVEGVKRDYAYTLVQLAQARDAHISVPSWMAYVTWVPDKLDFVAGNISSSTQELATIYQLITREFNRELAQRVEKSFRNDTLPIRWQRGANGCYETEYPVF